MLIVIPINATYTSLLGKGFLAPILFPFTMRMNSCFHAAYREKDNENGYDCAGNAPQSVFPFARGFRVLVFILLLLFATIGVCIWSIATHLRQRKAMGTENLVPVRKVTLFVVGGTVCLLLVSFLLASSSPIRINVADYEHTFWLKMAGMFVTASVVMIVVALCAILYDYVRHREN